MKKVYLLIIGVIIIILLGGTYSWYKYQTSKTSLLVLTAGSNMDVKVTISPSEITTKLNPTSTYSSKVISNVIASNNTDDTIIMNLYYEVNSLPSELINGGLKYTVTKSNTENGTYEKIVTGDFTDIADSKQTLLDTTISSNTTDYYKIYLWLDSSTGSNQDELTQMKLNLTLNGSLSIRTITIDDLKAKANPISTTTYLKGKRREMYTFYHEATEQTEATTDYRYIGGSYCSYDDGAFTYNPSDIDGTCPKRYSYTKVYQSWRTFSYTNMESCPEDTDTETITDCKSYRGTLIGVEPNNYIIFNDETWRIIGIFDDKLKIIKNESIGSYSWDYKQSGVGSSSSSYGSNDWTDSQLMLALNGELAIDDLLVSHTGYKYVDGVLKDENGNFVYQFQNSSSTTETFSWSLSDTAKSQIAKVTYYLGGNSVTSGDSVTSWYTKERGTDVFYNRFTSWTGYVGLMYMSDFGYTYALGVDNICYDDLLYCFSQDGGVPATSWMYNYSTEWTINPYSNDPSNVFYTYIGCDINNALTADIEFSIRPVVYLKSDIVLDGTGSITDPYVIK